MACALIPNCPFNHPYHEPDERSHYNIRLSIFLIYAERAGVGALVWALTVLHRHHKHKDRIPAFVIVVLLNDMLELLLNPYIITKLIQGDCNWTRDMTCRTLFSLWGVSVIYGVHLQQMMVLESVLALRHPSCYAHVFFPPCSIILFIITFICLFLCEFLDLPLVYLFSAFPLIAVTVTSWIVVCRTPPNENSSNRTKRPDCTVLAYVTITLILYLIFLTLYIFIDVWRYQSWVLLMMTLCLLSLRVIVDPLLCVLVCKQKPTQSPIQPAVEAEQSVETEHRNCPPSVQQHQGEETEVKMIKI